MNIKLTIFPLDISILSDFNIPYPINFFLQRSCTLLICYPNNPVSWKYLIGPQWLNINHTDWKLLVVGDHCTHHTSWEMKTNQLIQPKIKQAFQSSSSYMVLELFPLQWFLQTGLCILKRKITCMSIYLVRESHPVS